MKKLITLITLATLSGMLVAQVTIGADNAPIAGALLQLKENETVIGANSKLGLSMPRVILTTRTPAVGKLAESIGSTSGSEPWDEDMHIGLVVYNVNEDLSTTSPLTEGLYVWDGSNWQNLSPTHITYPTILSVAATPSSVRAGLNVDLSGTTDTGGTPIATGNNISVNPIVNTSYYAEAYNATIDCTSSAPRTGVQVTTKSLPPTPIITGVSRLDPNTTNVNYTTQTGMNSYTWTVTGGVITSGQGTASINVNWGAAGPGNVMVTYSNALSCSATNNLNVTIG